MKQAKFVFSIVLLVVLMALGPALTAFAQGPDTVNCNGLSDSDCDILKNAMLANQMVQSVRVPSWSATLNVEAEGEAMELAAAGSLAIILPDSLLAFASDLPQDQTTVDMEAMMAMFEQIDAAFVEDVLNNAVFSATLDQLYANIPGEDTVDFTASAVFKDSAVYVQLPAANGAQSWFGEEIKISPSDMAEFDQAMQEMMAEMDVALADPEFATTMETMQQLSTLGGALQDVVNAHVVTTRGDDVTVDGQTVYTFTTTFSLLDLIQDPDLPAAIIEILNDPALQELMQDDPQAAAELSSVTESQVQFVLLTASLLLNEATFSAEQWIGADDSYTYKLSAGFAITVDASLLGGTEAEPIVLNGSLSTELADYNAVTPESFEVPADYYGLDAIEDFAAGTPSMIDSDVTIGQVVEGSLDYSDTSNLYSLELAEGDAITLRFTSDDVPNVMLYGPDGFQVASLDPFMDEALDYTATTAGTYLLKVEAPWMMDFEMMIATP